MADLDTYKVPDLRNMARIIAKTRGLTGYSRLNKAELIRFIKKYGKSGTPPKPSRPSPSPKRPGLRATHCLNTGCEVDKICNDSIPEPPGSGRCVLRNGKIGKQLLGRPPGSPPGRFPGPAKGSPGLPDIPSNRPSPRPSIRKPSSGIDHKGRELLRQLIGSQEWVIISMEGCGYCTKAINFLNDRAVRFALTELDSIQKQVHRDFLRELVQENRLIGPNVAGCGPAPDIKDGDPIRFPIIFSSGQYIGGFGELRACTIFRQDDSDVRDTHAHSRTDQ